MCRHFDVLVMFSRSRQTAFRLKWCTHRQTGGRGTDPHYLDLSQGVWQRGVPDPTRAQIPGLQLPVWRRVAVPPSAGPRPDESVVDSLQHRWTVPSRPPLRGYRLQCLHAYGSEPRTQPGLQHQGVGKSGSCSTHGGESNAHFVTSLCPVGVILALVWRGSGWPFSPSEYGGFIAPWYLAEAPFEDKGRPSNVGREIHSAGRIVATACRFEFGSVPRVKEMF